MNREALPLIAAILTPIIIVALIVLYLYGYDVTLVLRKIEPIYIVIIFPIALGLAIALLRVKKP
jgi:hypothetical protein